MRRMWVVFATLFPACGAAEDGFEANTSTGVSEQPAVDWTEEGGTTQVLEDSQVLVDRAEQLAREKGNGFDQFRGAWMRQELAKRAQAKGRRALAAKFALQAWMHAAKSCRANGEELSGKNLGARAEDWQLARRADDSEYDRWMEAAERETPPAMRLLFGGDERALGPKVRTLLRRSEVVLALAKKAANEGGEDKDKYRVAWIRMRAAEVALENGQPREAAKFGLLSRKLAIKILAGNKRKFDHTLAETLAEKSIKMPVEDAPDQHFAATLKPIERSAPSVKELLEG